MKNRKNKIAALTLAASMLLSATGCSKNTIERTMNENNKITYIGNIDLNSIENLYIVEIKNLIDEREIYLTKRSYQNLFKRGYIEREFELIGTNIDIIKSDIGYLSDFGEIVNIVPLNQFIATYSELKENYTADEILEIFESIKSDYDKLIKKEEVKKLELKK